MTFNANQFTPTKHSTAEEKAQWGNQLVAFIQEGFPKSRWTRPFYQRLSMCFGHIAHYDIQGFWDVWFHDKRSQLEFLKNILNWPCYGDPGWTYSDVERAVQTWLIGSTIPHDLAQEIDNNATAARRKLYESLKEEFGDAA